MNRLQEEQPLVYQTLINMVERDEIPHALIFYGEESTSKKDLALFLSKSVYAKIEGASLEESLDAARIEAGIHPNIFFIEPTKRNIVKEQASDTIKEASKSSLEKGPKFFIFDQADLMNASAANSLLKFIEEPEDDVYIIFIVENMENLLPTIRSRCSLLGLRPLNKEMLVERFKKQGYEPAILIPIIEFTQKDEEINIIIKDEEMLSIISLVSELFLTKVEEKESMVLYYNENSSKVDSPEKQDFFFSLIITYLKDILIYIEFKNENFSFIDDRDRIKELCSYTSIDKINDILKNILKIKQRIKYYINLRLNLDVLLYKLENAFRK